MKKYFIILMLLPVAIFAQYKGGSGDGYTSQIVIVDSWNLKNTDLVVHVDNIIVAPNPTANVVSIVVDNNQNLEINAKLIDIQGRVVKDKLFSDNNLDIDLSDQKSGIFILQLWSEGKLFATRKLMKK